VGATTLIFRSSAQLSSRKLGMFFYLFFMIRFVSMNTFTVTVAGHEPETQDT